MLKLARRIYRISSVASMVLLVIVIALIMRRSPAPQVAHDPQAAAHVESKLQEAQTATESGQPQPLRLNEAELNALLDSSLALKHDAAPASPSQGTPPAEAEPSIEQIQSSVKDFKVNLVDDRVLAYVVFDFHGKDLSLVLEGHLHAEDGYLHFEPISGKLGSLPLPQSTLEAAVRRLLSSPENKEKLRLPPDVGDIRIENGQLVVTNRQ